VALPVEFHPEARAEFDAAADWYEGEQRGLGVAFVAAVEEAVGRLAAAPLAGAPLTAAALTAGPLDADAGELRRVFVHRFPYAVLYAAEPARLLIVAIAHLRRRPGYWRHRR
jgi:plasmid stabilization system protein ParE